MAPGSAYIRPVVAASSAQAFMSTKDKAMSDIPNMEMPDALRQMAEKNIEQARTGYAQVLDMMRKAQDTFGRSSDAMTGAALDLQAKILRFTQENVEASFRLASELAKARDMKDYFEIQSRHAQLQMHHYALQAQELGRLVAEVAQKSQPRA